MLPFVSRALGAALLLGVTSIMAQAADEPSSEGMTTLYQNVCATCHGSRGEGRAEVKAPSIAGLPDWYVQGQLESFRADRRGIHEKDLEGQMMRAVSKVLSESQLAAMARHVAGMKRVTPSPTMVADVAAGRELYAERCMECHRYNAEGELFFASPPLVGLQDWYLASQIRKYQSGIRGVHPKDVNGQKMVFSSGFVESEEVLHSLVAYLMELQKPKSSETASKDEDPFRTGVQEK